MNKTITNCSTCLIKSGALTLRFKFFNSSHFVSTKDYERNFFNDSKIHVCNRSMGTQDHLSTVIDVILK